MKYKLIFSVLIVVATTNKTFSQISQAEIIATGLTCSMCSNAILKQFKSLNDVDSVATDLNKNSFIVYLKKNNTIKPRVLKESVEKAGFFIGSMVVTMSFDNLNVEDNLVVNKDDVSFIFVDTKTKTLNGPTKVKIFDKGFVTQKEYKKLLKSFSKYTSYNNENENDYHLKAIY